MELILQVFYSVFSGTILAAAIPNELYLFGCPFLALFSLVPYYLVIKFTKTYKQAFLFGFIQTISTHLISSFWLAYFKDFAVFTLGASAFGTGIIGGIFGLLFHLQFSSSRSQNSLDENSLVQSFTDSVSFRILCFASVYTIYEWVKSSGFLGYPWGTVSSAMFKWPVLMQTAAIAGTYGVTFIVVMLNGILAEFYLYWQSNNKNSYNRLFSLQTTSVTFGLLFFCIFVYGVIQYNRNPEPEKILTTILVQQNSDPWKEKNDSESILTSQNLTDEALEAASLSDKTVDLIVWSEGCLKKMFPQSISYYTYYPAERPLIPFISEKNIPFIIGGSYAKNRKLKKFFNAALLFDNEGNFRGCYGKNHLVPFAEALPFIEYPKAKAVIEKVIGISAGWTPGDQYVFFDVPCKTTDSYQPPAVKNIDLNQSYTNQLIDEEQKITVRVSTPICFDDSFTDIMRPMFLNGAELFMNITDDSWSLKNSSEIQHFVIASYRAIEYRTTLVRSANAGYSVVVTPNGKIIEDMPLFEQASTVIDVPVYKRTMTTYARFGNWLPYTLILLFAIYAVYMQHTFKETDYIPSERKIKSRKKKTSKKHNKK